MTVEYKIYRESKITEFFSLSAIKGLYFCNGERQDTAWLNCAYDKFGYSCPLHHCTSERIVVAGIYLAL